MSKLLFPEIILPSFHGFYESIWNIPVDDEYEYLEREHNCEYAYDWIQVNRDKYQQEICEQYSGQAIDEMNSALDLHLKAGVVSVWSPREYNFTTDKIYVVVELSEEDRERIIHLMLQDYNRLQEVIHRKHSSCDGFISFMSNDIDEWLEIFKTGEHEDFGLYLGYALYYLWQPDDSFEDCAFESISGNVCVEMEPLTDRAKDEWEKVKLVEDAFGFGSYDHDKMNGWSVEETRLRCEEKKWNDVHLLKLAF